MTKRMLVDATHSEETRVAIVDNNRLEDLDFELSNRKMLKGNIYLAKVIRIEPSLQAAFVEYGGNRHGFLAFAEIHPDYYRIPIGDRPHDAPADDLDDESDLGAEETLSPEQLEAYQEEQAEFERQQSRELRENTAEDNETAETPETDAAEIKAPLAEPLTASVAPAPIAMAATPAWSTEPGSGSLADLIPGYVPPENNSSLITGFTQPGTVPLLPGEQVLDSTASQTVGIVDSAVAEPVQTRPVRQHRPRYKIQEVIKRRQVMLIQVVKEERGNKGAALTTHLSLAGRYCVLMPNTSHGGGVSRKITSHQDRRRMKEIMDQLEIPDGMAVILRTAGMEQDITEIQRDLDYLLRLWNSIREQTLQSTAPALIYEEANLLKRALRDLYTHDIQEILVAGKEGYELAKNFIQTLIPDAANNIRTYDDPVPLFFRYNVEKQIDTLHSPNVVLRSGGYIVINPTEALVSIDVNSGRATRERHIEETALKTNLEAAEEIARQLRLRDLAGLVVIDFIDMEDGRNNAAVERRLKEAMKNDRARLQIGRISHFGLLELSRQRLRPSLLETSFEKCPHCGGLGHIRSVDSAALSVLRAVEEEGIKQGAGEILVHAPERVAFFVLNKKRMALTEIERRYNIHVQFHSDESPESMNGRVERLRSRNSNNARNDGPAVDNDVVMAGSGYDQAPAVEGGTAFVAGTGRDQADSEQSFETRSNRDQSRDRDRGRNRGRDRNRQAGQSGQHRGRDQQRPYAAQQPAVSNELNGNVTENDTMPDDGIGNNEAAHGQTGQQENRETRGDNQDGDQRRRRRGRRGGRRRHRDGEQNGQQRDPNRQQNDQAGNHNRPQQSQQQINAQQHGAPVAQHAPQEQRIIEHSWNRPAGQSAEMAPRSSMPYEVVDKPSDAEKPKGGWWRKLTGGQ